MSEYSRKRLEELEDLFRLEDEDDMESINIPISVDYNQLTDKDVPLYGESNLERLLKEKMKDGWNIFIECKGFGRGYSLSYEVSAYNTDWDFTQQLFNRKHAVGENLESLIYHVTKDKKPGFTIINEEQK